MKYLAAHGHPTGAMHAYALEHGNWNPHSYTDLADADDAPRPPTVPDNWSR